ncbi:matrix metalloproteinase-21-like [Erpetoichthys calabaricus]|uniref:Matrix metalloproteinase-21-like n=1 Tax=Erpetoichthys calabaricus TaxID=27687 RepID=A0A8C4S2S4_ERPCA|nr:matrix metalloproteinase-21-like [Erpetoichthys calabaricus]
MKRLQIQDIQLSPTQVVTTIRYSESHPEEALFPMAHSEQFPKRLECGQVPESFCRQLTQRGFGSFTKSQGYSSKNDLTRVNSSQISLHSSFFCGFQEIKFQQMFSSADLSIKFPGRMPNELVKEQQPTPTGGLFGSTAEENLIDKKARRKRFLDYLMPRSRRISTGSPFVLGMAFAKPLLKWRLMAEGHSSYLSSDDQRLTFKQAFRRWSEVAPIDFEEDLTSDMMEIDIKLGFGTGRHFGCPQPFDGNGQELAHTVEPGEIHFDDDDLFSTSSSDHGISLLKVAVHEIGHVLGLPHLLRPGSVMHPFYLHVGDSVELSLHDRRAIQQLYGVCEGPFDTIFDWVWKERNQHGELVSRFNTYFFRKSWYWMYENRNNRTRYGDPHRVSSGWRGIPSEGIDAFVHVWTHYEDTKYFFKGTQYWRYNWETDESYIEDPLGNHYPRTISQGFPGITGPIDTAFFDRHDHCIYFFRGALVTAFNITSNKKVAGYSKRIIDVFPATHPEDHPIMNLDAAYYSYSHQALFLFKGLNFWRVAGTRDRMKDPSLSHNALLPHHRVTEQWFDICDVHMSMLAKK